MAKQGKHGPIRKLIMKANKMPLWAKLTGGVVMTVAVVEAVRQGLKPEWERNIKPDTAPTIAAVAKKNIAPRAAIDFSRTTFWLTMTSVDAENVTRNAENVVTRNPFWESNCDWVKNNDFDGIELVVKITSVMAEPATGQYTYDWSVIDHAFEYAAQQGILIWVNMDFCISNDEYHRSNFVSLADADFAANGMSTNSSYWDRLAKSLVSAFDERYGWYFQNHYAVTNSFSSHSTQEWGNAIAEGASSRADYGRRLLQWKTIFHGLADVLKNTTCAFEAGSFYDTFAARIRGISSVNDFANHPRVNWIKNNPGEDYDPFFDAALGRTAARDLNIRYAVEWTNERGKSDDSKLTQNVRNSVDGDVDAVFFSFFDKDELGEKTQLLAIQNDLKATGHWKKTRVPFPEVGEVTYTTGQLWDSNGYEGDILNAFKASPNAAVRVTNNL
jgi:hypothetical protein